MAKLIHNKRSNIGIIYDFILQELIETKVTGDIEKGKKIIKIIKEYFYNNIFLSEEFNLFNLLLKTEYSDRETAKIFITECLKEADNLKNTLTERKQAKQKLIEEIYKVCDKTTFFEHNLNYYNTYATINLLIDYYSKNKRINEIKYLIDLENKLLEHIVDNKILKNKDLIFETKDILTDLESEIITINLKQNYFPKLRKEQAELIEYYSSTFSDDLITNKLDTVYRKNFNILKSKYNNESIEFTKNKIKESLVVLSDGYKKSSIIEDKLKIVLDSFEIL
jgi:hypothetical protein